MQELSKIYTRRYESPFGPLTLGAVDGQICLCDWEPQARSRRTLMRLARLAHATVAEADAPVLVEAAVQLDDYFARRRQHFDLPLRLIGTPFQQQVWQALAIIPYAERVSYGRLAARLGRPSAVRAVAAAVGANPVGIILPCHRVVGGDGSLTGYAGGLQAKSGLLNLESASPC